LVNRIAQIQPTTYSGNTASMNGLNTQALDHIPVTSKLNDEKQKAKSSLFVLGGGAALGPVLGRGLDAISGADGQLVRWSEALSKRTPGLAEKVSKLNIGGKISNLFKPIKEKLFKPGNLDDFMTGFKSGGGLTGAAKTAIESANAGVTTAGANAAIETTYNVVKATDKVAAKSFKQLASTILKGAGSEEALKIAKETAKQYGDDAAKAVSSAVEAATKEASKGAAKKIAMAQRTLDSLDKINKTNVFGRSVGKTGLFLKKNLSGTMGIINGLFAAMTINSVIQAKKGEKFSTLMEDVLGTWVGSLGGFRLFESALKGLAKVNTANSGILPTIAKVVNKVPAKGFLLPLAGAIALSSVLQKLSHKLFGKPTKEEPKTIESVNDFNNWMKDMGWSPAEIKAIENAQAQAQAAGLSQKDTMNHVANTVNNIQAQKQQPAAASLNQAEQTSSYMPSSEIPQSIHQAEDAALQALDQKINGTLENIKYNMDLAKV
jgi:hypothetical protein